MIKKKPVSVKGLVFDMDGLLLDSEKVVKRSWDYAGKELGYENFGDHIYNTVGFNLKRRTEYFKTNVDLDFPMDRFAQMTREYYYKIADIMLCAGAVLIAFAVALILLWIGVLVLVRGISGIVRGAKALGRSFCVKEVPDNE